jgi:hypothetical protein
MSGQKKATLTELYRAIQLNASPRAGDRSGAMDFFDTCTRFEIHDFVEDELAHFKLKELAKTPGE